MHLRVWSWQVGKAPFLSQIDQNTSRSTVRPPDRPFGQDCFAPASAHPPVRPSDRPTVEPVRPAVRPCDRPTVQTSSGVRRATEDVFKSNRPSSRPTVRPCDRPTVRPSNRPNVEWGSYELVCSANSGVTVVVSSEMHLRGWSWQVGKAPSFVRLTSTHLDRPSDCPTVRPCGRPTVRPSNSPNVEWGSF